MAGELDFANDWLHFHRQCSSFLEWMAKNYLAVFVNVCAGMYVDVTLRAHILLVQ